MIQHQYCCYTSVGGNLTFTPHISEFHKTNPIYKTIHYESNRLLRERKGKTLG